jgi:hypothetical protein
MADNLVLLSDIIIRNPEVNNFPALLATIRKQGGHMGGAILLQIDLKPDYRDTPRNWEIEIEMAFTWGDR